MANEHTHQPTLLVSHFRSRGQRDQQSRGWSDLWESDQSDLWDRGRPSPALIDFIESGPTAIRPRQDGRRLRALVPGCGRGHDVAMLALHGFDAYGLEVSDKGAEVARDHVASQLAEPGEMNFGEGGQWPAGQAGTARIVAGDFFGRDWEDACVENSATGFDLIYDYTLLCALLPEMRKDWASRMSELLDPSGVLVCLEYPLFKDLGEAGPPWGLRGVHWNILARGGDGLLSERGVGEQGEEMETPHGKFKRALYFKPPRSHEKGQGTDMVSVWTLK